MPLTPRLIERIKLHQREVGPANTSGNTALLNIQVFPEHDNDLATIKTTLKSRGLTRIVVNRKADAVTAQGSPEAVVELRGLPHLVDYADTGTATRPDNRTSRFLPATIIGVIILALLFTADFLPKIPRLLVEHINSTGTQVNTGLSSQNQNRAYAEKKGTTPDSSPFDISAAERLLQQKKYRDALPLLIEARKRDRNNPVLAFKAGLAHYHTGNLTESIQLFSTAVAGAPDNLSFHLMLARAFIEAGQPDRALQVYENMLALDPENSAAQAAVIRLQAGDRGFD